MLGELENVGGDRIHNHLNLAVAAPILPNFVSTV